MKKGEPKMPRASASSLRARNDCLSSSDSSAAASAAASTPSSAAIAEHQRALRHVAPVGVVRCEDALGEADRALGVARLDPIEGARRASPTRPGACPESGTAPPGGARAASSRAWHSRRGSASCSATACRSRRRRGRAGTAATPRSGDAARRPPRPAARRNRRRARRSRTRTRMTASECPAWPQT